MIQLKKKTFFVPEGQFVRHPEEDERVRADENPQPDMETTLVSEKPQITEAPDEMEVSVVPEKPQANVVIKEPQVGVSSEESVEPATTQQGLWGTTCLRNLK